MLALPTTNNPKSCKECEYRSGYLCFAIDGEIDHVSERTRDLKCNLIEVMPKKEYDIIARQLERYKLLYIKLCEEKEMLELLLEEK